MKIVLLLVILATAWVSIEGALFFHTRPFPQTPKPTDGKILKFSWNPINFKIIILFGYRSKGCSGLPNDTIAEDSTVQDANSDEIEKYAKQEIEAQKCQAYDPDLL